MSFSIEIGPISDEKSSDIQITYNDLHCIKHVNVVFIFVTDQLRTNAQINSTKMLRNLDCIPTKTNLEFTLFQFKP